MQSALLAFRVMMPVFLLILVGVILRRVNLIPQHMIRDLNKLCFNCFLPILLFYNVSTTDFRQYFDWTLVGYAAGTAVLLYGVLFWMVPKFVFDPKQQSVVIQGIYRSNYVILGIPVVSNLYQGESIATITMLVALIVPMFNLMAVYLFEHFNGTQQHSWRHTVLHILRNPLIIGTALGMLYTLSGIQFPMVLQETIADLAGIAMPLALLILGADLNFHLHDTQWSYLGAVTAGRLLLVPLIFLPPAVYLGFHGQALASLLVLYASPAAVSGYIMAQNENADAHLAGQIVVLTSLLSCITLFIWITCLDLQQLL